MHLATTLQIVFDTVPLAWPAWLLLTCCVQLYSTCLYSCTVYSAATTTGAEKSSPTCTSQAEAAGGGTHIPHWVIQTSDQCD